MQDTAETELHVDFIPEVKGEVDRVGEARPLKAVIITRSGPVQLMPLVRLVSELRGLELSEVAPRLVSSSGIILRDATEEEVEAISQELNRQDVPFILVPTGELPEPIEVAQLFRLRIGPNGIRLRREDGTHVDAKWKNVLTVTCVRLKGPNGEGAETPARLVLSIFTREPFACYQLAKNIPLSAPKSSAIPYEPGVRFEREGRAIYETFPHSSQNKGMRILANYGLGGTWKGLTFERLEEVNSYNYWVAVLRGCHKKRRGKNKPKFSIPWLRKIEFEPDAKPLASPTRYRTRTGPLPTPVRMQPPVVISPPSLEWMPQVTRKVRVQGTWLNAASLIAAVCLALYIILEILSR